MDTDTTTQNITFTMAPEQTQTEQHNDTLLQDIEQEECERAVKKLKEAGVNEKVADDGLNVDVYRHLKPTYNALTHCLYLNGKEPERFSIIHDTLFNDYGAGMKLNDGRRVPYPATMAQNRIRQLACGYFSYNPLLVKMDRWKVMAQSDEYNSEEDRARYERLASWFLGDGLDLSQPPTFEDVKLRRFLAGAVNRAYERGCKFDTALLIKGESGARKSTFFEVLSTTDLPNKDGFYGNTVDFLKVADKDEVLKCHTGWFQEVQEATIKTRKVEEIKRFLTSQTDRIRPPYGRAAEVMPRGFVVVATTNRDTFFEDETLYRRFLVIKTTKTKQNPINTDLLRYSLDFIWVNAVRDYLNGYQTYLTKEEEKLNDEYNETMKPEDPAVDWVRAALTNSQPHKGERLYAYRHDGRVLINLSEVSDTLRSMGRRCKHPQISGALRENGFVEVGRFRLNGGRQRRYWKAQNSDLIKQLSFKEGCVK